MSLISAIEALFNQPPIPFKPEQQSLKAWAMYCLRDRGFKVIYAQNADFAVETRDAGKVYFKVTDVPTELSETSLDKTVAWIMYDRAVDRITVVAPQL